MIDPDCPWVPYNREPHSTTCDSARHCELVLAVDEVIDPPVYRAVSGDHSICAVIPCWLCWQPGLPAPC